MIKKLILAAVCAVVAAALSLGAFAAGSSDAVAVRSLRMGITTLTLKTKATKTIGVTISPAYADDKTITWISSDPSVATVTGVPAVAGVGGNRAVITAVAEGKAKITATSNNGKTAVCNVTVSDDEIEARSIEISTSTSTVRMNQTKTLFVDIFPYDTEDMSVEWSSSNPEIVYVESDGWTDGLITGVSPGTAVITATSSNGKVTTCTVTVPSTVLQGIERTVDSRDLPGAQVSGGELLSAAALRLDVENAIKSDKKAKSVTVTYTGKTRVSTAALRAAAFTAAYESKEAVLRFRTLDADEKLQGRLTINPQNATDEDKNINTAVYTSADKTESSRARAAEHFGVPVATVRLMHSGSFDMPVRVTAKTNIAVSAANPLKLYRYYGGSYKLIEGQECVADSGGYVHFTVTEGGTYVLVPSSAK